MNRLQATPVTVPEVCWLDRGDDTLGTPYYVMEQVPTVGSPGEFPPYHAAGLYFDASPEERATMWWGCVRAIADVHALDWRELKLDRLLMPGRGSGPLEQVVDYYSDALQWASSGRPRAELATAAEWLRDNVYEPEHLCLCWGDSRLSNILYGPKFEVSAVVDWEIAYIGDHEADLAWLLFTDWGLSEYQGLPRLDGTPGREETIERYEQLTGMPVRNLRFNEVLAAVALACPVTRLETKFRDDGLLTDDVDLVLRRARPAVARLTTRSRRGAVIREVGLDDRPHGAPAPPAIGARPTGGRHFLRCRGAVGNGLAHHVAGNSDAEADEHQRPITSRRRCS